MLCYASNGVRLCACPPAALPLGLMGCGRPQYCPPLAMPNLVVLWQKYEYTKGFWRLLSGVRRGELCKSSRHLTLSSYKEGRCISDRVAVHWGTKIRLTLTDADIVLVLEQ